MRAEPVRDIAAHEVETFTRDGAVQLRGIFDPDWLGLLADGVAAAMSSRGPYTRRQSAEDDPGLYFSDYWASQRVAPLERFVRTSPAAQIAARLMRSTRANFFFDAVCLYRKVDFLTGKIFGVIVLREFDLEALLIARRDTCEPLFKVGQHLSLA